MVIDDYTHLPGIIPARAGNMATSLYFGILVWDHPRSRGEYAKLDKQVTDTKGSSPLARGISAIISL